MVVPLLIAGGAIIVGGLFLTNQEGGAINYLTEGFNRLTKPKEGRLQEVEEDKFELEKDRNNYQKESRGWLYNGFANVFGEEWTAGLYGVNIAGSAVQTGEVQQTRAQETASAVPTNQIDRRAAPESSTYDSNNGKINRNRRRLGI